MITSPNGKIPARITQHAIDQAVKRFGVSERDAEEWIRRRFAKSIYVNKIESSDGLPSKLFAYHRICFVVSEDNAIVTVYHPRIYVDLHERIGKIVGREIRKVNTEAQKIERKNTILKAELEVERAELKLRYLRARSQAKKNAYMARITAIDERMTELDEEIAKKKREKVYVSKGAAAYV